MTLSTAEGGEPKDTAWIDFSDRKRAGTVIRWKIGYRGFDGNDHFEQANTHRKVPPGKGPFQACV